jgi:hypothetical protein
VVPDIRIPAFRSLARVLNWGERKKESCERTPWFGARPRKRCWPGSRVKASSMRSSWRDRRIFLFLLRFVLRFVLFSISLFRRKVWQSKVETSTRLEYGPPKWSLAFICARFIFSLSHKDKQSGTLKDLFSVGPLNPSLIDSHVMWGSVGQEGMPSVDGLSVTPGAAGAFSPGWLEFQSTTKMAILSERVHQLPA